MADEDDCNRFLQILDQWERQYNGAPAAVQELPGQPVPVPATDSGRK